MAISSLLVKTALSILSILLIITSLTKWHCLVQFLKIWILLMISLCYYGQCFFMDRFQKVRLEYIWNQCVLVRIFYRWWLLIQPERMLLFLILAVIIIVWSHISLCIYVLVCMCICMHLFTNIFLFRQRAAICLDVINLISF